jgi:YD repeat-containing protein
MGTTRSAIASARPIPNSNTSTSSFDALDRLASLTYADNVALAFAYDAVGNLLRKTDGNNQVAKYGYTRPTG